jgi:hypothetical protein
MLESAIVSGSFDCLFDFIARFAFAMGRVVLPRTEPRGASKAK